jgi:hypothetical protein
MTLKTTEREKQMDQAISEMRQPYDYRVTKEKLDKAAAESREHLAKLRANKKQ